MKKIIYILTILMTLLLSACHDDLITETVVTDNVETYTIYEVDLEGLVSDPAGEGISNATLTIAGQEVTADLLGHYEIINIQLASSRIYLSASAPGYISTGKTLTIAASGKVNANIIMTPLPDGTSSFSGADGGEITASQSSRISFLPSSILSNNMPYDGNVNVATYALEADYENVIRDMPGALIGLNQNSEYKILQTYGMIYATLTDDNGNKLTIAPNTPATISMDLPEQLMSNAPAEMPLWHFDEAKGYWKEEGVATLVGDRYEGEVNHFSWWNIDFPVADIVDVCLTISEDANGLPIANQEIVFGTSDYPFGISQTNAQGKLCVSLPQDEEIFVSLASACNEINQSIGAFSESTPNQDVTINIISEGTLIQGSVSACQGDVLTAKFGVIKIGTDRINFSIDESGNYSYNFLCALVGENIEVAVADPVSGKIDKQVASLNSTEITVDLALCDDIASNSFVLETDNESIILDVIRVVVNPNETILEMADGSILSFVGAAVGTYDGLYFRGVSEAPIENLQVTVTAFGNTISGSISGDGVTGSFSAENN